MTLTTPPLTRFTSLFNTASLLTSAIITDTAAPTTPLFLSMIGIIPFFVVSTWLLTVFAITDKLSVTLRFTPFSITALFDISSKVKFPAIFPYLLCIFSSSIEVAFDAVESSKSVVAATSRFAADMFAPLFITASVTASIEV